MLNTLSYPPSFGLFEISHSFELNAFCDTARIMYRTFSCFRVCRANALVRLLNRTLG
jgi:hypothetical protein